MPSYRWVGTEAQARALMCRHICGLHHMKSMESHGNPMGIPWESQVPIGWGQWYSALSKARREGLGLPCLAETTSCGMLTPELNGLETGVANDWLQNSSISHNLFGVDLSCTLFLASTAASDILSSCSFMQFPSGKSWDCPLQRAQFWSKPWLTACGSPLFRGEQLSSCLFLLRLRR